MRVLREHRDEHLLDDAAGAGTHAAI